MLPTLRATLPYTLAVAILAFLVFYLLNPALPSYVVVVLGVLLCGVLVPILRDVKGNAINLSDDMVEHIYQGETATLYVGNLPYRANEEAVQQLFEAKGVVINVRLMKDRQTGRRRGFGFVEVAAKDAEKMIQALNDSEFQDRTLKVREAKDRQES